MMWIFNVNLDNFQKRIRIFGIGFTLCWGVYVTGLAQRP